MEPRYPTIDVPATRDYVLNVIVDSHRQQCRYDPEADRDITLTFESTIASWRLASDLVGWRQLGRAMNEWWDIDVSDHGWREVLEPAKSKTLGDVCDLIAAHATAPTIRPVTFFGRACRPAAAFLTIRSMVEQAGADAASIGPSTPLQEYTREYSATFIGPISRLAPGALPDVNVDTPFYDATVTLSMFSSLLLGVAGCLAFFASPYLMIFAVVLFVVSWALTWVAARRKPASVRFGDLRTFRDLAKQIADHAPVP